MLSEVTEAVCPLRVWSSIAELSESTFLRFDVPDVDDASI